MKHVTNVQLLNTLRSVTNIGWGDYNSMDGDHMFRSSSVSEATRDQVAAIFRKYSIEAPPSEQLTHKWRFLLTKDQALSVHRQTQEASLHV